MNGAAPSGTQQAAGAFDQHEVGVVGERAMAAPMVRHVDAPPAARRRPRAMPAGGKR